MFSLFKVKLKTKDKQLLLDFIIHEIDLELKIY